MTHAQITTPLPFLQHWARQLHPTAGGGGVLDLACGGGRHGRLFLEQGWPVTFLDRDISGVMDLSGTVGATLMAADLETDGPWPLAGRKFDLVIVTNYLWRPILPQILDLVAPGGVLLYETFAEGNEAYGKPSNPNFLLKQGELKETVTSDFEILQYEQGSTGDPVNGIKQRLAARRRPVVFEMEQDGFLVSDDFNRLDLPMMRDYLANSYWYEGLSLGSITRAARHSLSFGLYDPDGRQVGYGRMVTDRTTFAYLADVFVLDEMKGRGLGKFLMQAITDHPDLQALKRHMLITADAHGLYEKYGYEALEPEHAWRIMVREDREFYQKRRD